MAEVSPTGNIFPGVKVVSAIGASASTSQFGSSLQDENVRMKMANGKNGSFFTGFVLVLQIKQKYQQQTKRVLFLLA